MFWLNLVIYFYPRHLPAPAPAPATSTRESRPAIFRHTLSRGNKQRINTIKEINNNSGKSVVPVQ